MRRLTSLVLSTVMAAGLLATVGAAPAAACGGMEQVSLLTYNLDIGKTERAYAIGDVAEIKITVTRPAEEDPLGNGIPTPRPYVEPVEDVYVGVGFHIGRVFLPGAAITDENGVAKVRIKIEDYAPAGKWADTSVYAWKVAFQMPCATVQEYGYQVLPRFFKTTS